MIKNTVKTTEKQQIRVRFDAFKNCMSYFSCIKHQEVGFENLVRFILIKQILRNENKEERQFSRLIKDKICHNNKDDRLMISLTQSLLSNMVFPLSETIMTV